MHSNFIGILAVLTLSTATAGKVIATMASVFVILQTIKKVFPAISGWAALGLNVGLSVIGAIVVIPPEALFSLSTFTTLAIALITSLGAAGFHGSWKALGPVSPASGLNTLALSVLLLLVVASLGCHKAVLHPGAINAVDSNMYDTLLVAQAALNQAKSTIDENPNALYSAAFNRAAALYNQAEADWKLWHSTRDGTLLTKLTQEVNQVVQSIADMQKAFGMKVGGAALMRPAFKYKLSTVADMRHRKQVNFEHFNDSNYAQNRFP